MTGGTFAFIERAVFPTTCFHDFGGTGGGIFSGRGTTVGVLTLVAITITGDVITNTGDGVRITRLTTVAMVLKGDGSITESGEQVASALASNG